MYILLSGNTHSNRDGCIAKYNGDISLKNSNHMHIQWEPKNKDHAIFLLLFLIKFYNWFHRSHGDCVWADDS